MSDIASETLVARVDGAIAEGLLEDTVLLDPNTDRYVRLNRTGTLLWETLAEPTSVSGLASLLEQRFALSPDRASRDAAAFVRQLAERGLIELGG